jgi:[acyl-carrier-protein] S-malonyltransferase
VRQANHPVRWAETILAMTAGGVSCIAECGPGKVLAPLVKRIADGAEGIALPDRESMEAAITRVKGS